MRRDVFVSVIIPLQNDADILPAVVEEIDVGMRQNFGDYELLFIDDGSTDITRSYFERAKAKLACFRYVRLTRTFGVEEAIACGLEQAVGDVIVVLNPASDPPACIPHFVDRAMQTQGIVIGCEADSHNQPLLYRFAYFVYFEMCKVLLPRSQIYGATRFMALTRTALNEVLKIKDSFRYVRVLAMYVGFEVTKISYQPTQRRRPARRRKLLPLLASSVQMIVANSNKPLRIAALLAAILGVADLAFLVFVVSTRLLLTNVQYGWASTNFFNAIMFAGLFLVLAVVCEYLAEMRGDVKNRPLYVVQYELQSNAMLAHQQRLNVVADEGNPEAFSLPTKRDELAG
jgi:polyisoprenyl-phosphate glycosyltransferase